MVINKTKQFCIDKTKVNTQKQLELILRNQVILYNAVIENKKTIRTNDDLLLELNEKIDKIDLNNEKTMAEFKKDMKEEIMEFKKEINEKIDQNNKGKYLRVNYLYIKICLNI